MEKTVIDPILHFVRGNQTFQTFFQCTINLELYNMIYVLSGIHHVVGLSEQSSNYKIHLSICCKAWVEGNTVMTLAAAFASEMFSRDLILWRWIVVGGKKVAARLIHLRSLTWVTRVTTFPLANISCVISNLFLISVSISCCQEAGHTVRFVWIPMKS